MPRALPLQDLPGTRAGRYHGVGAADGATFLDATTAMTNDEAWSPAFDRLWDCRGIILLDMLLAETCCWLTWKSSLACRWWRAGRGVLVATREVVADVPKLLKARFRNDRPVEIVCTMEDALAWLGKDQPPDCME